MATVLYVTAEVLRQVGILVQPYMPHRAGKLLDLLAVPQDRRRFAALATRLDRLRAAERERLPAPAARSSRAMSEDGGQLRGSAMDMPWSSTAIAISISGPA